VACPCYADALAGYLPPAVATVYCLRALPGSHVRCLPPRAGVYTGGSGTCRLGRFVGSLTPWQPRDMHCPVTLGCRWFGWITDLRATCTHRTWTVGPEEPLVLRFCHAPAHTCPTTCALFCRPVPALPAVSGGLVCSQRCACTLPTAFFWFLIHGLGALLGSDLPQLPLQWYHC